MPQAWVTVPEKDVIAPKLHPACSYVQPMGGLWCSVVRLSRVCGSSMVQVWCVCWSWSQRSIVKSASYWRHALDLQRRQDWNNVQQAGRPRHIVWITLLVSWSRMYRAESRKYNRLMETRTNAFRSLDCILLTAGAWRRPTKKGDEKLLCLRTIAILLKRIKWNYKELTFIMIGRKECFRIMFSALQNYATDKE